MRHLCGLPPTAVRIDDDGIGGYTEGSSGPVRIDDDIDVSLAGMVAEFIHAGKERDPFPADDVAYVVDSVDNGDVDPDDWGDVHDAVACYLQTHPGPLKAWIPSALAGRVHHVVRPRLAEAWPLVSRLAEALAERGALSADDVAGILGGSR